MKYSKSDIYPTLSVIIPTYNREKLIARSIRSVLHQTYRDFELILIDDGSTDETEQVVQDFGDERIRFFRQEENRGAAAARNIGIKESKGTFIAFQDSDDEWLPEKLERHMQVFEKELPGIGVVYSDMWRVLKNGKTEYHKAPKVLSGPIINPATQWYQVYMQGTQSVVVKKLCFDQAGYFNEEFLYLEDLELFIRLSKQYGFYHIQEPLVRYHEKGRAY